MTQKVSSWRKVTTVYSFKDSKTVRVFGIVRVSTDKQAKKIGESLDHQKEVLKNWVRSKSSLYAPQKWELVEIFVENESSDGQMIMRNHANLAQWQAERIAQYSLETISRHLSQCRPIGPPPIGYRISKDINGKTTYEPDHVFKKHVKFIDQTYLRVKSAWKVVDSLHQKGFDLSNPLEFCTSF